VDGSDNDCDGAIDGADTDVPVTPAFFDSGGSPDDDDGQAVINFSGMSFPFCGSTYTSATLGTNGFLQFGGTCAVAGDFSESVGDLSGATACRRVAVFHDDLDLGASTTAGSPGITSVVDRGDVVSIYYIGVPEWVSPSSAAEAPNFGVAHLYRDGRVMLQYGPVDMNDGANGWSCGNTGQSSTDLSAADAALPGGSLGIGTGLQNGTWEFFFASNDMDNRSYMFCPRGEGVDSDGDGFADSCDYAPNNASLYPGR